LKLKTREVYGAVIVDIHGQLIGGSNSERFQRFIAKLLNEGKTHIIVNLRGVPWANSQGVGMLIGAQKRARTAGGDLVLTHVTDKIYDILSVTRLCLIFTTFDNENDAAQYMRGLDEAPSAEKVS
jgi:anti-sigma B factor antagonist